MRAVCVSALLALGILFGFGGGAAASPGAGGSGQLLVTLTDGSDASAASVFAGAGVRAVERLRPLPVYRVAVDAPADAGAALARLRASPLVRAAETDDEQTVQVVPNDPLYHSFQWNLKRIGMEQAWDLRPSAPDVVVAVLDTGVDLSHPDLRPNLLVEQGYDFINGSPSPQDDESHGTAVAGIIGAVGNNRDGVAGIAWRVKILPIKALNSLGRGPDSAMVKAILYATDAGARIINISSTGARYSAALETAVSYAQEKGALIVAAAGNTGDQDNAVSYPAAFDGVLAVAAVDDQDQLASFSQRGGYVALAAPGVEVPSTAWAGAGRGLYASQSGTSIAAPHVSGVAALLWAMRPDMAAADIAATLKATADRVGPAGDGGAGAGVVNAARAIAAVRLGVAPRSPDTTSLKPGTLATTQVPQPAPLPAESRRWLFAEGSTKPPFDASFALLNPNPRPATAHFTFLAPDGKQTPYDLRIEANSRASLSVNDVLPNAEFGTIVQSDIPVYVERTMYFGHDGHTAAGVRQANRTWFLAEGSTVAPFDTWLLMMNPNTAATSVTLTFMREDGTVTARTEVIPAFGRRSVYVNPLFSAAGFSTQVQSEQPIVVERAMYVDGGQGGDDAMATPAPGRSWYLAGGTSRNGFDTWLLVQNSDNAPANVKATFMTESGAVVTQPLLVPPHGRASLYTDPLVPDASYGMRVDADRPVVVERSVYFAGGHSGYDAAGVAAPATEWFLPTGDTTGSFEEQLVVLNPQGQSANVQVELRRQEGEPPPPVRFSVAATTQSTIDVNPLAPDASVALHVTADQPVVVERTSYFARPTGLGATTSTGITR